SSPQFSSSPILSSSESFNSDKDVESCTFVHSFPALSPQNSLDPSQSSSESLNSDQGAKQCLPVNSSMNSSPQISSDLVPLSSGRLNSDPDSELCHFINSCPPSPSSVDYKHQQDAPPCPPWCGNEGLPCYACSTFGVNSLQQLKELEKSGKLFELALTNLMKDAKKPDHCSKNVEDRLKETQMGVNEEEGAGTPSETTKGLKFASFVSKRIEVVGKDKDSVLLRVLLNETQDRHIQES
ncbi:unnamed protein product, partial [Meganyctiphanes norvegica]